jgi:hypothetical protein
MTIQWKVLCAAGLLMAPTAGVAQEIQIDPSLASNAQKLPVKKGAQWPGRTAKWQFGEFVVASSKMGMTITTANLPLLTLTDKRKATSKFSFVLVNTAHDSVRVGAEHVARVAQGREIQLGQGWTLGDGMLISASDQFVASIVFPGDSARGWTLTRLIADDADGESAYEASLTDGDRTIGFEPVGVARKDRRLLASPAYGYEFFEGEESLGAVQYRGGLSGQKQIVWLRRDLDARTRLVLAAAMTALLQMTSGDAMP